MLSFAIILITAALVFYTIGVWAEHRQGTLKPWHVIAFALGLACDASGTYFMSLIADQQTGPRSVLTQVMMGTGAAALLLMLGHLIWALVVLLRNRDKERRQFHKLSVGVWAFWLIPYFTGMAGSMVS